MDNAYRENDDYHTTKTAIEALARMTEEEYETINATDRDGYDTRNRKHRVCSDCGQSGYEGAYPFSTIVGGNICDDCI